MAWHGHSAGWGTGLNPLSVRAYTEAAHHLRVGCAASCSQAQQHVGWQFLNSPNLALYNACMRYCILDSQPPSSVEELAELRFCGLECLYQNPERLVPMVEGSRYLYTARGNHGRNGDGSSGLVRAVGGWGHSIAYIRDLSSASARPTTGRWSALLKRVIEDFDREDDSTRLITTDVGTGTPLRSTNATVTHP